MARTQFADVADLAKALLPSEAAVVGRWCTRRLLPQLAVPQDCFDHVVLTPFVGLANRCLQPLGHLSGSEMQYRTRQWGVNSQAGRSDHGLTVCASA